MDAARLSDDLLRSGLEALSKRCLEAEELDVAPDEFGIEEGEAA